ncbi:MAG: nitrous oxide-stimulated promoter family protein [Mucinivorans sp.]
MSIDHQKKTIEQMVRLYCRHHHGRKETLCEDCQELLLYCFARLDHCHFGSQKPSCSRCTIHCYRHAMRERIRRVMRFSGPRMIIYAPWATLRHMIGR